MRMALTGSKHVTGFDINKHQQLKHGKIMNTNNAKADAA